MFLPRSRATRSSPAISAAVAFEMLAADDAPAIARQRAAADVMWRTLQFVMPPDKIEAARKWHEEAMKYADPSKIDPMEAANNVLSLTSERDRLKTQVDEMTKARETADKAALGAINARLVPVVDRLARALAHVINLLDPDVIVLGGGLSKLDRLYASLPRLWRPPRAPEKSLNSKTSKPAIKK